LRTEGRPTGVGLITLNDAGENHIIIDLGANLLLSPADIDAAEAQIAGSALVATVLEIPVETAARAMTLARRHGVTALLNPAPASPLEDSLLREVDLLTPNESELRILSGLAPDDPTDTVSLARRLQARGVRRLVVTCGEQGALVIDASGTVTEVSGVPTAVVDTTGAGDAFNSALAVAVASGRPLVEAACFAACAGALACTRLGVIPALPTRQALEALWNTVSTSQRT
jgi:ribokinase